TPADNVELYRIKTVIAALAIRENWHADGEALPGLVARCREEFPGLAAKTDRLSAALGEIDLWSELGALPDASVVAMAKDDASAVPAAEIEASEITTEIQGRGQSDVEVVDAQDEDGEGSELPTHTFEKAETLEEQTGLERKTDADDDLEDHAEALDEVNMTQVVRSAERPKSIYRSDIILDGLSLEVGESGGGIGIPYPEWDYKKRNYKEDWCFLNEGAAKHPDPSWCVEAESRHRVLIQQLKRQFAAMTSEWMKLKRQPNGTEFDIDAVVDGQVELRSGHTPHENIYLDRKRDLHDMSVLVLLDVSYSTDAWLNDKRVLDTIRDTVFCMGEVLDEYLASFAVAGFSSNTRRSCRFEFVKSFQEPWSVGRCHLGGLDPAGYTRIGPALRHAQELLVNEIGRRKVVILITDGRPCDYDRYEGTYGIHDVKKAIETGQQHQVFTHAFVVEKKAEEYFPRMFTGRHFDIVSNPDHLSHTMCRLFSQLMSR
ncbi:MAG: nitric oxide reductase NorD protein, partial [Candidatus Krumholzibacteriia bacterium]